MLTSSPRDSLTRGERLLIRAVRILALGGGCQGLRGHFEAACGAAGDEAYRTLTVFVQQMGSAGLRRLRLSVPADLSITADEAAILDVFGAAQADDYRSLDERLSGLLGAAAPVALGAAAAWVAQAFALHGLTLRASLSPPVTVLHAAE